MSELEKSESINTLNIYLKKRHGTTELDPLPTINDHDPLNWPPMVKALQLAMIAFHAFSCTFMAAGLIPSFVKISKQTNKSVNECSYLTSAQIIILGVFPFLWVPLMNRYGRRQLLMLSTLGSAICNIGCIYSESYGALMTCRILEAFMISPAAAVGGPVVSELTFSHQRAARTGLWAVGVTLGTHVGPLLMSFVDYHTNSTKSIFIVFAVMNAVQFLCYLFWGKETVYDESLWYSGINTLWKLKVKSTYTIDLNIIVSPFKCFTKWKILIPTIAYSVCFSYANVALGVELTKLYHEKYAFNPQQIGLQFISLIIGVIIGEQVGGWISDRWMRLNGNHEYDKSNPEHRIWLAYVGFAFCIAGNIVYGVVLDKNDHWTVVPNIGLALSSFGLQIITTVLITYCIDVEPKSASDIALFVTFMRQLFGFIGPFYFPVMLNNENLEIKGTYSLLAGLMFISAWLPMMILHFISRKNLL